MQGKACRCRYPTHLSPSPPVNLLLIVTAVYASITHARLCNNLLICILSNGDIANDLV